MKLTLNCLREGETARIVSLQMKGGLGQRLRDFGLIPGTAIRCLRKCPLGNPVLYCVRDTRLALRTEDSRRIWVEREPWQ